MTKKNNILFVVVFTFKCNFVYFFFFFFVLHFEQEVKKNDNKNKKRIVNENLKKKDFEKKHRFHV